MDENTAQLLEQAREAMTNAYAPYSDFKVGAALRATDGTVFRGANVENASLGLTVCAERAALCSAVSQGYREFDMLALACSKGEPCVPCGACRQFLAEFSPDLAIVTADSDGRVLTASLAELLPKAFRM